MKKFLALFALTGVVFLLSGCGKTEVITDSIPTSVQEDVDLGMYTGQEFTINQTKEMADFQIKLNKIIIGDTNFGTNEDGYKMIIPGYVYKRVIGDFTVTSKIESANISSLQFGIGWKKNTGGETFNSAVYNGQMTTGAQKFGFYQDGYSIPLTKGESKDIKVIISLMTQFSGNGPYTFNIGDENHLTDDKWILLEFPIEQNLDK